MTMSDKHHHGSCGGGHSCGSQSGCGCSEDAEATRREFLRQATTVTLGGLSLTILPGMATESSPAGPPARFGFLVDTNKCIGAGKCLSACRMENDVPDGYARTWVERSGLAAGTYLVLARSRNGAVHVSKLVLR